MEPAQPSTPPSTEANAALDDFDMDDGTATEAGDIMVRCAFCFCGSDGVMASSRAFAQLPDDPGEHSMRTSTANSGFDVAPVKVRV